MINVMTVHWRTAKWIEIQLDYLHRNIETPFRVFAALNGIDAGGFQERFHFAADLTGSHPEKLNALADIAGAESDPNDVLLFLDGDAFPVRPLHPVVDPQPRLQPELREDQDLPLPLGPGLGRDRDG